LEAFESILAAMKCENEKTISHMRERTREEQLNISYSLVPKKLGLGLMKQSDTKNPISESIFNPFEGWLCRYDSKRRIYSHAFVSFFIFVARVFVSRLECETCAANSSGGARSRRWKPSRHQLFTTLPLLIPTTPASSTRVVTATSSGSGSGSVVGGGGSGVSTSSNTRYQAASQTAKGMVGGGPSLHGCLQEFFQAEHLDSVTCSACSLEATAAAVRRKLAVQQRQRRLPSSEASWIAGTVAISGAAVLSSSSGSSSTKMIDKKYSVRYSGLAASDLPSSGMTNKGTKLMVAHMDLQHGPSSAAEQTERETSDAFQLRIVEEALTMVANKRVIGENDAYVEDIESGVSIFSPLSMRMEAVRPRGKSEKNLAAAHHTPSAAVVPIGAENEFMLLALQQYVKSEATKITSISRLPPLLCLYLCRRVYDETLGKMKKINQFVSFPLRIDMSQYNTVDGNTGSGDGAGEGAFSAAFRANSSTKKPDLGADGGVKEAPTIHENRSPKSDRTHYMLRAVVVHKGSADTGS
jgi:hypothetical protein